jgi:quercetin dioxygenase-like cupin family protein
MVTRMNDEIVFIKKGEEESKTQKPGKLYRMMVKSENMEAIIAELDPYAQSVWHCHTGEELHLVLQGEMEYTVGDNSYRLSEGDILWHRSTLKHRAANHSRKKVVYITIGTPPTFM